MIVLFKDNKALANDINNLLQRASILHENVYEKDIYKIFKKYDDAHVEPKFFYPRTGWGWTWSAIRTFANLDEHSAYLPESNKIDKDALDELRSEDLWFKSSKVDILKCVDEFNNKLETYYMDDELTDIWEKLSKLLKGE